MTLATSLRSAARNLITTFGNNGDWYDYATATVTENEEGDITVTDWGAATVIKIVDGDNITEQLTKVAQGLESLGEDEKIIRDDAAVAVNDRLTINGVSFRVESVRPIRTQDTLVVQIINVARVTDTTNW